MHDWIAFCEAAMIAPDAHILHPEWGDRRLAERFEQMTGKPIAASTVKTLHETWDKKSSASPGTPLKLTPKARRELARALRAALTTTTEG